MSADIFQNWFSVGYEAHDLEAVYPVIYIKRPGEPDFALRPYEGWSDREVNDFRSCLKEGCTISHFHCVRMCRDDDLGGNGSAAGAARAAVLGMMEDMGLFASDVEKDVGLMESVDIAAWLEDAAELISQSAQRMHKAVEDMRDDRAERKKEWEEYQRLKAKFEGKEGP